MLNWDAVDDNLACSTDGTKLLVELLTGGYITTAIQLRLLLFHNNINYCKPFNCRLNLLIFLFKQQRWTQHCSRSFFLRCFSYEIFGRRLKWKNKFTTSSINRMSKNIVNNFFIYLPPPGLRREEYTGVPNVNYRKISVRKTI